MSDFTDNYSYEITSNFKGDHKIDVMLQWQTTPPTEPGWYWVAQRTNDPRVTQYYFNGRMWMNSPKDYEYFPYEEYFTHWLGPLPVPELPKG